VRIGQLVNLLRGGEPVRMSKRAGETVDLDEVIEEVGVDVVRYHFLRQGLDTTVDFDLAVVAQQSMENPVYYVQYAHARISSLIRMADERGFDAGDVEDADLALLTHPAELELLTAMAQLPLVVADAAELRATQRLARYARSSPAPSTASTPSAACSPRGPRPQRGGAGRARRARARPLLARGRRQAGAGQRPRAAARVRPRTDVANGGARWSLAVDGRPRRRRRAHDRRGAGHRPRPRPRHAAVGRRRGTTCANAAAATSPASPASEVTYASKAWPTVGVLQLVDEEGLWIDVASGGELHSALVAGVAPERIILHGNNKSEEELDRALAAGVGRIVVDSFVELERLERLAAARDTTAAVWLRITPGIDAHTHEYVRTGHDDAKFGFTLSLGLADQALAAAVSLDTSRSSASTPTSARRSSAPTRSSPTPR
jgi:hypothetical protein